MAVPGGSNPNSPQKIYCFQQPVPLDPPDTGPVTKSEHPNLSGGNQEGQLLHGVGGGGGGG